MHVRHIGGFTPGQMFQCWALISRAEIVLGTLSAGQRRDLLLDNFSWIPSSAEAHGILEFLYPTA